MDPVVIVAVAVVALVLLWAVMTFNRLVRARNRFVARVHMLCLLDNRRVQRIARGLGGALAFYPGEAEAQLDLRWPDALTGFEEWLDEAAGVLQGEGAAAFRPSGRNSAAHDRRAKSGCPAGGAEVDVLTAA